MSLRRSLPTAAGVAAAFALAAPATGLAAGALPAVERTIAPTSCDRGLDGARGPASTSWVAPMSGYLTVRTKGASGTDVDAALVDAASGRRLAASRGFGSAEVLQSWVRAGQRVDVRLCRVSGSARRARVSLQLLDVAPPKAGGLTSLVDVRYRSDADLARIEAAGLDLTHQHGGGHADVIVTGAAQMKALKALRLPFEIEIADMDAYYARSRKADARYGARVGADGSGLPTGRTAYRVYDDFQREMKQLVEQHGDLVKPVVLPKKSFQGREVQGVEISDDVNAVDGKPTFFLMGVHHAREWPSAEAAIEFAHLLVQGAKTKPRIQAILRSTRVVVVPLINPDGYIASRGALVSPGDMTRNPTVQTAEAIMPPGGYLAYRRKNCGGAIPTGLAPCELQYGIDPNRNYGEGWGGRGAGSDRNTQSYRGTGPWSEPETQNVHEFSQTREVTALMTLHTVGALVLRPPGRGQDGKAPDENGLKAVGDAMGAAAGYPSQYSFQLYDTSGTTEDWNYAAAGTYGYTIEIGPKGGQFHMPYQTGVVDQWTGDAQEETEGKGLREALLLAADAAGDPSTHAVIKGRAPAGRTLRIKKAFTTKSGEICTYAQGYLNISGGTASPLEPLNCAAPGPRIEVADKLEMTTVVPADGHYDWHVNQSTRPFVGWKYDDVKKSAVSTGVRESYTLTCEDAQGTVLETRPVTVDRGDRVTVDLACAG